MPFNPASSEYLNNEGQRRFAIYLLAIGQTVVWACLFYVFPAMVLRWESIHHWSKTEVMGAITLTLLLSAVMSPWVGRLIDRGYGPQVMSFGAAFGAALLFMVSWAESLWQFYLAWALMGLALAACLYEPCFMLVTRAYGSDAKRSIVTITLIAGFASTVSFPFSHYLVSEFSFRAALITFSASALLVGVPALYIGATVIERHAVASRRVKNRQHRVALIGNTLVMRLGLCFAMLAIVHGATLHHLLSILYDRSLSPASAVFIASLIGPMQVAGRVVMTLLQSRVTHSFIAHGCFLFIGISMSLLFFSDAGISVAILFAVFFGASYGVVSIIRPVIARDILGDDGFGAKSGYLAFFYLIGSAISPYLGSLIWKAGGYDLLVPCLALLALAGLIAIHRVLTGADRDAVESRQ